MNDIFVDNCAAGQFANPLDIHFKEFFKWLVEEGYLVVSQKLLVEYARTCGCTAGSNIGALVYHLTAKGRLIHFKKQELDKISITKQIARKLLSNQADHIHIKTVILSHRRFAVTMDKNLRRDLNGYPGYKITVAERPEKIGYH